ncbi:MAG: hypothetical protein U1A77_00010 [Pirellulales bacterium]
MWQRIAHHLTGNSYRVTSDAARPFTASVTRGSTDAQEPDADLTSSATPSAQDSHFTILQKLIPGEAISVYLLAQSLSSSAANAAIFMDVAGLMTVALAATIRIFLTQDITCLSPWRTIQWKVVGASSLCCVIWIYAIGGSIFVRESSVPDVKLYAQILGFVFAAVSPYFVRAKPK